MEKEVDLTLPNYNPFDNSEGYNFDTELASHAVDFFPLFLRHDKGKWAGEPFELASWQVTVIANLFGWTNEEGIRRYRTSLIELPRKTGKSHLCAGLALFCLISDKEKGAEVYTAAADRDQASIVFGIAKRFVEQSELLSQHCKIYRNAIVIESTGSTMKALSSDSRSVHGLNASAVIADELHVWTKPDARDMWDALSTSQGARKQPLLISITTAGTAEPTLWRDQHNYAEQVMGGVVKDPTYLPAIWAADKEDDWKDPEVWSRVNPSLGLTTEISFYEKECEKAMALPSYVNAFRRLYLNQPTESMDRWLSIVNYDECEERMTEEELEGRKCFAGLDLSSTIDLSSLVLAFPRSEDEGDGYDILPYFFVPEENIHRRQRDDGVPYVQWRDAGYLTCTSGDVVDYSFIRKKINELGQRYDIQEVAIDRWNATQVAIWLQSDGFNVAYFGQGYRSMSAPAKELEASVVGKRFRHGGHPVLRWNATVCSHEMDAAGNIKPSKKKSGERIDGIVASVMALGRATASEGDMESVYESRGMELL